MAYNFNCLGLGELVENDTQCTNMVYDIVTTGKEIKGYFGYSYYIKNYGSSEFIVRTVNKENKNSFEKERGLIVQGVDTHTRGNCVWNVRVSAPNVDPEDADIMEKRVMVHHPEKGTGMAIINIVNADVIPSYLEDDLLHMQVVGLADFIEYYASGEEYEDSIPKPDLGSMTIPADGLLMANGYLHNRNPESPEFDTRPEIEDINLVRGTVTQLLYGTFDVSDGEEEPLKTYIRCFVETGFGTLEIEHTLDQVKEEQQEHIEIGATVIAGVVLSGDVAIDEYENGIIVDEEHDLKLLKYTLLKGETERFISRLANDCVYMSDTSGKELSSKSEIKEYIDYVKNDNEDNIYVYRAMLDEPYEEISDEYPVGRSCLAISYGEPRNFEQLAFIEYDEQQQITKIKFTMDDRFRFRIEESPTYDRDHSMEDLEEPETFYDAMLLRAQFAMGLQRETLEQNDLDEFDEYPIYKDNAEIMMRRISAGSYTETAELVNDYFKAFGELFAKAIGMEEHERAFSLGSQFYKDYARYHDDLDISEVQYQEEMVDALVYAQVLGRALKQERNEHEQKVE